MVRKYQVALLIDPSAGYMRGLLRGILRYVSEHPTWRATHGPFSRGEVRYEGFTHWRGDGIIARIDTPALAQAIGRTGVAVVDVSSHGLLPGVPSVIYDNARVGTLAAEHLMQRGVKRFAFCGHRGYRFVREREAAFRKALRRRPCEVFPTSNTQPGQWQLDTTQLAAWIDSLRGGEVPVGLLAAWDGYGEQVLDACRMIGVAVPDELAVIGVDDDELLCELADPPLTSVRLNAEGAGYRAAELLDKLMAGGRVPARAHRVEPLGVTERLSTDTLRVSDPLVAAAVRYIRDHATQPLHVTDLSAALGVSRRSLEARFKAALDRSPFAEISRVKVQCIQRLLAETDLPLHVIADRCGFDHVETLIATFKRITGKTPGRFRLTAAPLPHPARRLP